MVLLSCCCYECGVAYVLLVWRYDMPLYAFLLGELLLLWNIPFVFAPNRSVFSKLVEGSKHQALLSSLLSIAASAGGVVGPIWLGASVGEPSIRRTLSTGASKVHISSANNAGEMRAGMAGVPCPAPPAAASGSPGC